MEKEEAAYKKRKGIEQSIQSYESALTEAKHDISRAYLLAKASTNLAEAYNTAGELDKALGFYNKARAAFLIAAGMDRRYYRQVAMMDFVLIEILEHNKASVSTTKYILDRLREEHERIHAQFPECIKELDCPDDSQ